MPGPRAAGHSAAGADALDARSQMTETAFTAVCQTARISALAVLLGVVFPWIRVRGEGSASSVEGYETADGVWVFVLGFVTVVAVAVYKNTERLWSLVLAFLSSLAITATAVVDMVSLRRLVGDWPEPREASVQFGLYTVLVASIALAAAVAVLVFEYARQDKADRQR